MHFIDNNIPYKCTLFLDLGLLEDYQPPFLDVRNIKTIVSGAFVMYLFRAIFKRPLQKQSVNNNLFV